jgi:replicative DNA helicase
MVNREYERALVGRILTKPDELFQTKIKPEHLGDPLCKAVLTAINADITRGVEPNLLTVSQHPALANKAADIASLTSDAAITNIGFYEREIISAWRARKLADLGRQITAIADKPDEALDTIERAIQELTTEGEADRVYTTAELVKPAIATIEDRYHAKGALPGLSTGLDNLDGLIGGLQPRKLYYIGARPSQGKSAILLNMATTVAVKHDMPVGIISAESSKEELVLRDFANLGNVDSKRIASGMLKHSDFMSITEAAEKLYRAPLHIYDVPNLGITRLISVAKMMHRRYGIKALFVDYVQIIQSTIRNAPKRDQVAEVSLALKALSRQLEIPVIAAAQLTRDAQDRRPTLADFADASQIEKDADVAILLQQERDDADRLVRVWGRVEKHRDGPTGAVPLQFKAEYVRFVEEEREAS